MQKPSDLVDVGPSDARYSAFRETITQPRPLPHRDCARVTDSVMDGEDVVQKTLFEAYRKLDKFYEASLPNRGFSGLPTTVVSTFSAAAEHAMKPRQPRSLPSRSCRPNRQIWGTHSG